jgi:hypothetical protein
MRFSWQLLRAWSASFRFCWKGGDFGSGPLWFVAVTLTSIIPVALGTKLIQFVVVVIAQMFIRGFRPNWWV